MLGLISCGDSKPGDKVATPTWTVAGTELPADVLPTTLALPTAFQIVPLGGLVTADAIAQLERIQPAGVRLRFGAAQDSNRVHSYMILFGKDPVADLASKWGGPLAASSDERCWIATASRTKACVSKREGEPEWRLELTQSK